MKLDGEWFYVQTANTGAKMRVGIYAKSTTTGHPTGNPLVTCTEIDAPTTSYKTDTLTKTGWIMPGLYAGRRLLATNDGTAAHRAPPSCRPQATRHVTSARYRDGHPVPVVDGLVDLLVVGAARRSALTWTAPTSIPAPFVAWKVRRLTTVRNEIYRDGAPLPSRKPRPDLAVAPPSPLLPRH